MSGIDKTRDELFSEYFEDREGSAQVAEHAYRQGWKDRATYTVVPASPTQGADARPVAITAQNFDSRYSFCKHYTGIKDDTDDKQCLCEGNREHGSWCARDICPLLATRDATPVVDARPVANPGKSSDAPKPREVTRESDFSVTVVFSSCRLASEFERQMLAASTPKEKT